MSNSNNPYEKYQEQAQAQDQNAEPVAEEQQEQATGTENPDEVIADLENKLKRYAAEVENTRKRFQREREKLRETDQKNSLLEWLKLIDSIYLAMDAAPPDDTPWHQGLVSIQQQAKSILSSLNVERLEAKGKPFDAHVHEAMSMIPNPELENGTVAEVIEPGYLFNGTLLRPAKVMVVKND